MVKRIPLSKGFFATVDDEDFEWLSQWKWSFDGHAYAIRFIGQGKGEIRQALYMHRVIVKAPAKMEVDHVNGDALDNRRGNLRLVTRSQNLRNRKTFKSNKSGFKGITFNPINRKWKATINLGTFDTAEEAARAYDDAITKLFGSVAKPNFEE